jgi:hypothetical protein
MTTIAMLAEARDRENYAVQDFILSTLVYYCISKACRGTAMMCQQQTVELSSSISIGNPWLGLRTRFALLTKNRGIIIDNRGTSSNRISSTSNPLHFVVDGHQ